jgi:hypothetical protein
VVAEFSEVKMVCARCGDGDVIEDGVFYYVSSLRIDIVFFGNYGMDDFKRRMKGMAMLKVGLCKMEGFLA